MGVLRVVEERGPNMLTDHSMPRRASPSKIQILWGLNAVAFVLVVIEGSCSYVKHHPELLDQHLAMSSKTSAVAHAHGDLAKDAKDLHKQHQKSVAAEKAHSDSRKMNLKTTAATTVPNDESEKAPPAEDHGGILPQIPVKYLPFVIVGFMLAVPILTVSVLKGCWAVIDLVAPMQGAPKPDNYAQRKLQDVGLEDDGVEQASI